MLIVKRIRRTSLSDEVKEEIYKYINENLNNIDKKLPTEEEFAKMLGVSRITVRTALNDLANDGVVLRRQGKGTFINREIVSMKVQFNPVTLYNEMIEEFGYEPSVEILETRIDVADEDLAMKLNLKKDSEIVVLKKMFFADGNPCVYCEDYFAANILEDTEQLDEMNNYSVSVFEFIDNICHSTVVWDSTEILTTTNIEHESLNKYFNCNEDECKSFLLLDSVNFNEKDRPILYAKEYVDTKYVKFNSIRQKRRNL